MSGSPGTPRVTVIMTVLNEESGLPAFLDSLTSQTLQPDEVVVTDGGSTDRTVELLRNWSNSTGMRIRVIEAPGANISEGRNLAVSEATTEWIAVTDAGTVLAHEWLESLMRKVSGDVDVVCGFFEPLEGRSFSAALGATITPLLGEIRPSTFLPSSRSVAFRRDAAIDAGLYPEWLDYCEDLVFDLNLRASGKRFVFAGEAIAKWDARPNMRAFFRQYYKYARGDGKADLWVRRHIVRYSAYAFGIVLVVLSFAGFATVTIPLLVIGTAMYLRTYVSRVLHRRYTLGGTTMRALLMVPAIVVTGDMAKMIGYPVGVRWRAQHERELRRSR